LVIGDWRSLIVESLLIVDLRLGDLSVDGHAVHRIADHDPAIEHQ